MSGLSENQKDALETLEWANHYSSCPQDWCRPMDIGGSNGSHHSGTLNALAKRGLVQFKFRGEGDPADGQNGRRRWRGRGAKVYRITPAGRDEITRARLRPATPTDGGAG